ncbi:MULTISPECIES: hypothetical protein [unclassified Streptomyces]|uniref:hypothetical protein n=1 Tax=unclassified Streptomyces TaxID=2593676 RepID=UPI002E81D8E5|nr:hypothetical protein [Streptomyces sp. NBC_00523]WUC99752.1 hypothetical protein OHS17_08870 [Streptomyces sp. NBC_00523]
MSTERPDNDVTTTRRRSPLVAASVAAAVLLAGGGGAYWAATAADGGDDTRSTASGGGSTPPPLALDDAGTPTAPSREGIAPGEPDPHGGRLVYRASGKLPDAPEKAAVQRAGGTVTAAEVTRLAKALGLSGTPQSEATAWKVGSDGDGSGPVLRVNKQAPGSWTFTRYGSGGTDNCKKGAVCALAPGGSGQPVDEKAAKAAAAPVLKAAGQDDAALDAQQLMGSVRVVNADPVVDGLPTYGWATGIQVGPDGQVTGGSGKLKALEKGDAYPVIGAAEALKRLNAAQPPAGEIGGCASPAPLSDGVSCGAKTGAERPATTVTVEKAVFGLAVHTAGGEQLLVPSWIFSVKPAGGLGDTVTQVAVDPEYLKREPVPGKSPDGDGTAKARAVQSYSADGRTLAVTFWGGVCSTYTASAREDGDTVRVTVEEKKAEPGKVCVMIAKELTRTVTLERPLDGRKVMDDASGSLVPRA